MEGHGYLLWPFVVCGEKFFPFYERKRVMAELILKVGDSENPFSRQDGDITNALSDFDISLDWLQNNICSPKNFVFNKNNLRDVGSVLFDFHSEFRQYKFEHISDTEFRKTNQFTGEVNLIQKGNPAFDYFINFLFNRMTFARHLIFGSIPNRQIWFGGRYDLTQTKLDNVWAKVTAKTGKLKADHILLNQGTQTLISHYCIKLDKDLTKVEQTELQSSILDTKGNIIYKAKNMLHWQDIDTISPITIGQINNYYTAVDGREKSEIHYEDYVEAKS